MLVERIHEHHVTRGSLTSLAPLSSRGDMDLSQMLPCFKVITHASCPNAMVPSSHITTALPSPRACGQWPAVAT